MLQYVLNSYSKQVRSHHSTVAIKIAKEGPKT